MLADLELWARGKQLAQTQTFQRVMNANGDTLLPVFLYDIKRRGNEWLLVLWNQVPSTNSQVASVMANGSVGQAQIHMNNVVAGSIPGFATYFWFLPDRNVFANIRFQHAIGGHAALQTYIRSYLDRFSSHVDLDTTTGTSPFDMNINGYRASPTDPVENFSPRYKSFVFTKPGEHELLIQQAHRITKVLRRTYLELQTPEDLDVWQKLWRKLHQQQTVTTDTVSLQYEMKSSLSREAVQDIIQANDADSSESTWDDIGFQLSGESSPRWLNKSYARDKFDLDIARQNAELVNLDSLFDALTKRRTAILSLLD
ncbi:MAG TPA: hypothetical protein DEF75_02175 [Comamonas kerstersii]|nr:MAG TPA: hypothetical protein [Caudoviricetes sp.]HBW61195.1 hypothetical protein [Comamonas kerstersii]